MTDSLKYLSVITVEKLSPKEEQKYKELAREKAYEYIKRISDSGNESFIRDYADDIIESYVEGFMIGLVEGRAEMIKVVSENLKAMGLSEEQIKTALKPRSE